MIDSLVPEVCSLHVTPALSPAIYSKQLMPVAFAYVMRLDKYCA